MLLWNVAVFIVFLILFASGVRRLKIIESQALKIITVKHTDHMHEALLPRPRVFRSLTGSTTVSSWLEHGTERFEDREFKSLSKNYRKTLVLLAALLASIIVYGVLIRLIPIP